MLFSRDVIPLLENCAYMNGILESQRALADLSRIGYLPGLYAIPKVLQLE